MYFQVILLHNTGVGDVLVTVHCPTVYHVTLVFWVVSDSSKLAFCKVLQESGGFVEKYEVFGNRSHIIYIILYLKSFWC